MASVSSESPSKCTSPKLGATSEWIVENTGHFRSQFMEIAVSQLISTLCDVLSYYNSHPELSPSSELLIEAQELCIPIATNTETFPLIEALLQHCHQERWEFPADGTFPLAPVSPFSHKFLHTVTKLQSREHKSVSNLVLSYKSQVVLWTQHPPALEQEVLDIIEACSTCSEESVKTYINAQNLSKACAEYPKLQLSFETLLRELVGKSPEAVRILHIFNQTVSQHKVPETETLLSQYIPCPHT